MNKLGIQNFSIWSHLEFIILESKCCFFIWPNLTWSNLLKWDTEWPQMKKLWIPSLIISARSTIVTKLIFPFEKFLSNTSHNFLNLKDILKLYHTLVKLELHFVEAFSNEKMSYIRIVDIDELNKLGIQNFSIWDNLGFRKLVCRRRNLKITNLNRPNFLK